MEIPNLFVYACHFVEPNNEFVKNSLNGAIVYFINTLHKMPYQELAKNAPKPYFTEMINTVVSLYFCTFFFIPHLDQTLPFHHFDLEAADHQ